MIKINLKQHKQLALCAANVANHVLPVFQNHSTDPRPQQAIEAARAWARGEIKIAEARKFAFAAHAAARTITNPQVAAAARAAGHAAATAHVPAHAKYVVVYALKATNNIETEKNWQLQNIPKQLKAIMH